MQRTGKSQALLYQNVVDTNNACRQRNIAYILVESCRYRSDLLTLHAIAIAMKELVLGHEGLPMVL